MPIDYGRGKVYKIVCNETGKLYVGSTCEPTLAHRLAKHIGHYKLYLSGKYHFMTSYIILENSNYDIVLIENVPCTTKDELRKRERHYIESLVCVNKVVVGRSTREYKIDNKETIKIQQKSYRLENNDKIKDYREKNQVIINQHFKCYCGGKYTYSHKAEHMRSNGHLRYLNTIKALFKESHQLFSKIDMILSDVV